VVDCVPGSEFTTPYPSSAEEGSYSRPERGNTRRSFQRRPGRMRSNLSERGK
jgi:hypothetical protein